MHFSSNRQKFGVLTTCRPLSTDRGQSIAKRLRFLYRVRDKTVTKEAVKKLQNQKLGKIIPRKSRMVYLTFAGNLQL